MAESSSAAATYSCFDTVITNSSGSPLVMSIFGGKTVAHGDSVTIPGNLAGWLASAHPGIKARRLLKTIEGQVDNGILTITSIPTAPCGVGIESSSSTA